VAGVARPALPFRRARNEKPMPVQLRGSGFNFRERTQTNREALCLQCAARQEPVTGVLPHRRWA
jgi:hypothetical protein